MKNLKYYLERIKDFYEYEEVERTIEELELSISVDELIDKFQKAKAVPLETNIWNQLDNTDFVEVPEDIINKLKEYGRDKYNYRNIKQEINRGIWYPPLILYTQEHGYYLVAGNTRLMVAQVLKINPTVKIVSI